MRFYLIIFVAWLSILTESNAQQNPHQNIIISDQFSPNEPTIAIHPRQSNILMAGSNIDNLYLSKDGGYSWQFKKLRSTYGVWGDPVIVPDTAGNFYFFHLSNPPDGNWIDRIICQRTEDYGQTWTNGSYFGLNGSKAQDKHWAVVDQSSNYTYLTWTQFDKYGAKDPAFKSSIMFSMSKDEGSTWSAAQKINEVDGDCIDSDKTTEGAVPAIGPEGQVYVAWAGPEGLVFDRSMDGGLNWLDKDIKIDPMPGGWDYKIPGIYRCNGLPVTVCDLSEGPHRGTIYVNWTDQRNGSNDTDVWLSKSKDQGNSWSDPVRVNTDRSRRHQFLTWMAVDRSNGFLYFVFYDRRDTESTNTNVYMARSTDGGATFVNFRINDKAFVPNEMIFFGDYNNIVAQDNIVRPIWTRLDGEKLSIKTAIINVDSIGINASKGVVFNPDSIDYEVSELERIYVSFKLKGTQKLHLFLFNERGRKVKKIFKCKTFDFGKHILPYTVKELDLKPGRYSFRLQHKRKILKERFFQID